MTSWVFEENGHDEGKQQPSDLIITENTNLTATNLSLPTETFLRAAVSLKDQVVEETWKRREMVDPTVYKGLLGTAFTCLRSYEVTGNHTDLQLCAEIVDTCATVARDSLRHVTFLCGRGGAYALGAVVANYMGDSRKRDLFLGLFIEVFPNDRELRDAAIKAGEVVWKSGLVKKVGLADGVAGNAYGFLSLFRLTKEQIYEERAKVFSCFLYRNGSSLIAGADGGNAYSLFQGIAGTACLWFDLVAPHNSRFPCYEL
ncbi:hypothetical protein HN873_070532 [Arachis hypogaea]